MHCSDHDEYDEGTCDDEKDRLERDAFYQELIEKTERGEIDNEEAFQAIVDRVDRMPVYTWVCRQCGQTRVTYQTPPEHSLCNPCFSFKRAEERERERRARHPYQTFLAERIKPLIIPALILGLLVLMALSVWESAHRPKSAAERYYDDATWHGPAKGDTGAP